MRKSLLIIAVTAISLCMQSENVFATMTSPESSRPGLSTIIVDAIRIKSGVPHNANKYPSIIYTGRDQSQTFISTGDNSFVDEDQILLG